MNAPVSHRLRLACLACSAVLGFADPVLAADSSAADFKKIEGVWQGAAVDGDGSKPGSARARISELVITAEKITAKDGQGNSLGEGTFKLGRNGNVVTIDASGTAGQTRGKQYLGILIVEGDTLKWCSANPNRPRPAQFRTTPPDAFLMVLTRKKN